MCILNVIDGKTCERTRIGFSCSECGRAQILQDLIVRENLHNNGSIIIMKHSEGVKDNPSEEEIERAQYFVRELTLSQGWA